MRGCVRLRSSRKVGFHGQSGTPRVLVLRPLRARSQPRSTRQRLHAGWVTISAAADEPCEAAFCLVRHRDVALVESACTVNQALRVYLFCDRCALDRSLVLLVSGYNTELLANPVVADEPCEAALGLITRGREPPQTARCRLRNGVGTRWGRSADTPHCWPSPTRNRGER